MAQDSATYCAISSEGIAQRIAAISDAVGGNSALAKICDVAEGTVRNWRIGPSEPSASNLVAVARAGGVTVEWLATGKEPRDPAMVMSAEGYLAVPLYDVRLVAVCNDLFDAKPAAQSILVPAAWPAESVGINSARLAFIRMYGDAMKPALLDGDLLLVNRADDVVGDGIYVYFLDGWLFVQRLQRKPGGIYFYESEEANAAPSLLPAFADFPERSGIIGRVVWTGRKL